MKEKKGNLLVQKGLVGLMAPRREEKIHFIALISLLVKD